MTGRVVHVGQAIVDLVMSVDEVPAAGQDVFASSYTLTAGGGFNVMAAARRDGAEVVYAGAHGTGRFGDIVRAAMADEGVEVVNAAETQLDTGFCVALVDAAAERTFVSTVGAEGELDVRHLDEAHVREGDVVYVSGYGLYHPGNAAAITSWLPRVPAEVMVVVDTSPMIAHVPSDVFALVAARADLWTANEEEACALHTRLGIATTSDPAGIAAETAVALDATVVVRVNRAGCWVAAPGTEPVHVPAFEMVPVDTNGAGDAHTGVLCAGIVAGEPLLEVGRRAAAAAAIAVTRRGPATPPLRGEIDELVRSAGRAAQPGEGVSIAPARS
ncbi:PfkB family carbohydrate kinase [Janibacter melonis]|uniref:PfkB family carbohydrate kinase n=1 Tax=Janibacter melonis TaxID=262209 RepID=UPI00174C242E|nr:PfkB family carbohydrate kinase [Janibacter melonis]